MKTMSDKWQVTSDTNRQSARGESIYSCHPSHVTRHTERGVALVLTLILLSVTLLMALAFLAMSNRERNAASTSIDTATARLAADAALPRRGANRRQYPLHHQSLQLRPARLHELHQSGRLPDRHFQPEQRQLLPLSGWHAGQRCRFQFVDRPICFTARACRSS